MAKRAFGNGGSEVRTISNGMKNTGMNRKLDVLGRIVIPAEIRKSLDLKEGGVLDISMEDDRIILTPRHDSCVFCGTDADLKGYSGRMVCSSCLAGLDSLTA